MKLGDRKSTDYWLVGKIILGLGVLLLLGALLCGFVVRGSVFHPILAASNDPTNCVSGPNLVEVRQCVGFEEPMRVRILSLVSGLALAAYSVAVGAWLYRAGSARLLRALKWAGSVTGVTVVVAFIAFFQIVPHSQQMRFYAANGTYTHGYTVTEKSTIGYGVTSGSLMILSMIYALGYVAGSSFVLLGRRYDGARIAGMRKEELFQ